MVLFYHYQLSIIDPIFLESRKCSRESLFVSYEHYISADYRILSISALTVIHCLQVSLLIVVVVVFLSTS